MSTLAAIFLAICLLPVAPDQGVPPLSGPSMESTRFAFDTDDNGASKLRPGVNVKAQNNDGWTMLSFTAIDSFSGSAFSSAQQAKLLIDAGAEVNLADHHGRTPLMLAAATASSPVAKVLIDAKADVNKADKTGMTALMYAAAAGDWFMLRQIVSLPALSGENQDADTQRRSAMMLMQLAPPPSLAVSVLLEAKPDIDAQSSDGWTALMFAATAGWTAKDRESSASIPMDPEDLVLIGKGIDDPKRKAAVDKSGAKFAMPVEKVKLLLASGAKVDPKNHAGKTALTLARMRTDAAGKEIVDLLEAAKKPQAPHQDASETKKP